MLHVIDQVLGEEILTTIGDNEKIKSIWKWKNLPKKMFIFRNIYGCAKYGITHVEEKPSIKEVPHIFVRTQVHFMQCNAQQ